MEKVTFVSQGQKIVANLSIPFPGSLGVVMSYGMEGSKDGTKWQLLAIKLYEAGIASLRFNYRGCGEGADRSDGEFENSTLGNRIKDLKSAVDFFYRTAINNSRIGIIGSSLGGMVAIAAWDKKVKVMVTLATPYQFPIPTQDRLGSIRKSQYITLSSGRKTKANFFEELNNYDASHYITKIKCPLLIIHGTADDVVPAGDSRKYYEKANEPKKLEMIQGGNHSLDEPEPLQKIVDLIVNWFKLYL